MTTEVKAMIKSFFNILRLGPFSSIKKKNIERNSDD